MLPMYKPLMMTHNEALRTVLDLIAVGGLTHDARDERAIEIVKSMMTLSRATISWSYPVGHALHGMTSEKWANLPGATRESIRDNSQLHPKLIGLEHRRVRVTPRRAYGLSTFRVGKTTGWRPSHLAVRSNAMGSSDTIDHDEVFDQVEEVSGSARAPRRR